MKHYDIIYVTNLPAFYKIRLLNEIAIHRSVLAIFVGGDGNIIRNDDFSKGERLFDSISLSNNRLKGIVEARKLLKGLSWNRMIVCGNNAPIYWYFAHISPRWKNADVCESSIHESSTTGLKALIKKYFNSRFYRSYVPGESGVALKKALGYQGEIVVTHGVGIFNYHEQPKFKPCSLQCNKLLYVGRLAPEKNLRRLIGVVNRNPKWELSIVGFGPDESELKSIAGSNIKFLGAIENSKLNEIYPQYDAFILPSISEAWGLVVEEALNNGLPVALSKRVGCALDWATSGQYGVTFEPTDLSNMEKAIAKILTPEINNEFRHNISKLNFEDIERKQVECYI